MQFSSCFKPKSPNVVATINLLAKEQNVFYVISKYLFVPSYYKTIIPNAIEMFFTHIRIANIDRLSMWKKI